MFTESNILNIINNKECKFNNYFNYDKIKSKLNFLLYSNYVEKLAFVYGLSYLKTLHKKNYLLDNIGEYLIYCIIIANKYLSDNLFSVSVICDRCEISLDNYIKNEFLIIQNLDYQLCTIDSDILNKVSKLVNVWK